MRMRRLTRDKVVSVTEGKEIVGVYWEDTDVGSPTTRIKLWESLSKEDEEMKVDSISGIWKASTLSQALSIFNNVRGL